MKIDNEHGSNLYPASLSSILEISRAGKERPRPNMERPTRTKDLRAHATDPESRACILISCIESTGLNLSRPDCFPRLLENSLPGFVYIQPSFLIPNSRLSCAICATAVRTDYPIYRKFNSLFPLGPLSREK